MQLDWNDLKFFLALAEHKCVKDAAEALRVNHTTVIRRIDALEYKLETKLFIRNKGSVELTDAAKDIVTSVKDIKDQIISLERKIVGQTDSVHGDVVLTLPLCVATHLIIPRLNVFYETCPGINLEFLPSSEFVNLAKREADIAIRLSNNPERHLDSRLFGRKIADISMASYTSAACGDRTEWVAWDDSVDFDEWVTKLGHDERRIRCTIGEPLVQVESVKHGVGNAILPCFLGDQEDQLQRQKDSTVFNGFEAWVVTHEDLKDAEHIQAVKSFIFDCFEEQNKIINGECAA